MTDLVAGLRQYQLEGVQFLKERQTALLADEMGLGKTVQAAVALRLLVMERAVNRALIVVPNSLKINWVLELKKWAPELSVKYLEGAFEDRKVIYDLPSEALVASYDQIRVDSAYLAARDIFDLVLIDEAQWIKNPNSKVSYACRALRRKWSWAMTGTPLENTRNDLISIGRFFAPDQLKEWMTREQLHETLQPIFLRRHKEDVFDELPEIIDQQLNLELTEKQRQRYQEVLEGFRANNGVAELSNAHLFAVITKLKQICNVDFESQESSKLDALQDIVDNLTPTSGKLLVFSQYVETLNWLSDTIVSDGVEQEIFHGGIDGAAKHRLVTDFNDSPGPKILYVSLRSGGAGLNLGEADCVVLFDRWWNPAVESQAIARAIRFGRMKPLQVFRFLVNDTIEQRIDELLQEKMILFDDYIEDAEIADLASINRDDYFKILGLKV